MIKDDQTAKADAGKLKPSLVEPELIEVAAKLEEYADCPITAEELNSPPWDGLMEEV